MGNNFISSSIDMKVTVRLVSLHLLLMFFILLYVNRVSPHKKSAFKIMGGTGGNANRECNKCLCNEHVLAKIMTH